MGCKSKTCKTKKSDKSLRMYTMTGDSGFAPHVKDRLLSLACCAGPTREQAEVGDFVLGISGKEMYNKKMDNYVPRHTLIYLMRVDEKLTFDEYFSAGKFIGRADNIYVKRNGIYIQNRRHVTDKGYNEEHKDLFSLKPDYKKYFIKGVVSNKLRKAFNEDGCSLPSKVTIIRKKEKIWAIRDDSKKKKIIFQVKDAGTRLIIHKGYDDAEKSEYVILSKNFYYFGDYWKNENDKNKKLKEKINKICNIVGFTFTRGGHNKKISTADGEAKNLLNFIKNNYVVRKHGESNNLPDKNQKSKCCKQ